MTRKPVIGITFSEPHDAEDYRQALEKAGAEPLMLPLEDSQPPDEILQSIHGLMLAGGPDVDPSLYGESPRHEAEQEIHRQRDGVEIPLIRAALDQDLPVLAICRGMQMLNVALGGRLIQNLQDHEGEERDGHRESAYHRIYISPGSKLAAILGSGGFVQVNSRHHQGLREPQKSPVLMASAYALNDGIIEGLESPNHRWVIGIQCHPERASEVPKQFQNLFLGLVERASQRFEERG